MKLLIACLLGIFALLTWVLGLGIVVSVGAAVLKLCGVTALSAMSYWLPLQLISGFIGTYIAMVVLAVHLPTMR
jgi:hypothetical protein